MSSNRESASTNDNYLVDDIRLALRIAVNIFMLQLSIQRGVARIEVAHLDVNGEQVASKGLYAGNE